VPKVQPFRPLCPTSAAARTPIGAAYPCGFSMMSAARACLPISDIDIDIDGERTIQVMR